MQASKGNPWGRLGTCALAAVLAIAVMPARAAVVMNATRYIYHADTREISVKVTNSGRLPALTQAWIDDGDASSTPEHVDVPFNLTPPIARIEPGKSQTLRVSYTGGSVPEDRESVFWLNILEVPPKPADEANSNKIQLAFRYRLKMFYRPKGLKGSAAAAPRGLAWSRSSAGGLRVTNDSAYNVTLNDVRLVAGATSVEVEPFAIAPFASVAPALAAPLDAGRIEVRYQSIDDYGGFVPHDKTIDAR